MDDVEQEELSKARQNRRTLTSEQRVVFVLLIFIGILGTIFGFGAIPAHLRRPFDEQLASYKGPEFLTESEQESREAERQKTSDTDKDGLKDYDELYVFKTSPYLTDSDSDGFDDKTEVYSGNDPNCPTGKNCGTTLVESSEGTGSTSADVPALLANILSVDPTRFENTSFQSLEDVQGFFSSLSAAEVRSLLISQGIPAQTVEQLSDEQLQDLLQTSVEEASTSGQFDNLIQSSSEQGTLPASESSNQEIPIE